ncbi:UNVERIFIED_CONTAM: hypothetical protein Sangu_0579700 [Sesamum angustifolium]|uniref:HIG1 domain-containing protein n=1 Tax=Sesamum angustifolium TaxID=2727405 RepID=A0AAW2QAQ5_9LAMI
MAESTGVKSKFESIREWVVDNKLRTVGGLWASGVIGSLAYNWGQPGKASVKIIHARHPYVFESNFTAIYSRVLPAIFLPGF